MLHINFFVNASGHLQKSHMSILYLQQEGKVFKSHVHLFQNNLASFFLQQTPSNFKDFYFERWSSKMLY